MHPDGACQAILLCASDALAEGARAVAFDVVYAGQPCRAFAVRWQGAVHAYLNRCSHVPMEMDYQEGRFFDDSGRWLLCATHGATYAPDTGACVGGPCRGGLVKVRLSEKDGLVHWHTDPLLQPPAS
ncbi:Ferredoxin subunit of nitrite reductase or a ring-hydroxylating dioxygenase [Oryzisolibacter propanilivorax]|uniref:Ferredoxin subunit of nitrite reductase or a ring-hydroxylating dioxygenase n=1 Tax=Oryzisolibacter propanilivorax TaxID=1527607 RepID=A0A1G9TJK2_9BURK|nr:Rieske 2Fe-2S domain-containing protein [Oryzisolibacter propanilivorax]SDM47345.1 Ferredoxin subunit of nitrite reductase or a ring-hydroxylating dioxygenase [Oryzisolibacter propanilivorax]